MLFTLSTYMYSNIFVFTELVSKNDDRKEDNLSRSYLAIVPCEPLNYS